MLQKEVYIFFILKLVIVFYLRNENIIILFVSNFYFLFWFIKRKCYFLVIAHTSANVCEVRTNDGTVYMTKLRIMENEVKIPPGDK